jgi:hypothetical protein
VTIRVATQRCTRVDMPDEPNLDPLWGPTTFGPSALYLKPKSISKE